MSRRNTTNRKLPERVYEYNDAYYTDGTSARVREPILEEEVLLSKRTAENRARATSITRGYILFLSVACCAFLFMCVHLIQLKTEITQQTKTIAARQNTLEDLKADNDAMENSLSASTNISEIYKRATEDLGMHYPNEDQIEYYSSDGSGYVRQYTDVN